MDNNNSRTQLKEEKLKPLLPTLREKKRFVKFKLHSDANFTFKKLSEELVEELILLLGAIHYGKAGIWLLRDKFDEVKQEGILKVSIKAKDELIGALSLIQKLDNKKVRIETLKVSGTLKGLREQ